MVSEATVHLDKPWALRDLPPFPAIATKLLQVLSKEDVPIEQVIGLIRNDPAFSAELLRVANSALFGFVGQINTLKHATVVLGLDRVRALALTIAMGTYLKAALRIEVLRRCWRHSLACALLSEEVAGAASLPRDFAYTAGLLHDVGRLGLLVAYPTEYANLLSVTEENAFDILESEAQLFDIDHGRAGEWLMKEWQFPAEFVAIAARHHERPAGGGFGLIDAVRLACRMADSLGFWVVPLENPKSFQDLVGLLPEAAQARMERDPEALKTRVGGLVDSFD